MSKKSKMQSLMSAYGRHQDTKITYDEYESISHYYKKTVDQTQEFTLDDITWNDLDLDTVFLNMNHTHSSVGRDYLYRLLRTPVHTKEELEKREKLITYFDSHKKERTECEYAFSTVGFTKKISIADHIDRLLTLAPSGNLFHILMNVCIVAAILFAILVNPVLGILLILGTVGTSIFTYYQLKSRIDSFFACMKHFVNMLNAGHQISKLQIDELDEYNAHFHMYYQKFADVRHGAWLLTTGVSGSLVDIFLEYIRMITHVDLMKFNSMLKKMKGNEGDIFALMADLGYLEAMISIASYRHTLPLYCLPDTPDSPQNVLEIRNVYHTSIKEPVANSIKEPGCVLITGSNASGKSTFLKSVAISAVMAQTIHTVPAQYYKAPYYRIYSSMALSDNLDMGESYYMVEIKSLKRIVDASKQEEVPVLCFIDEVLRGTNTVERIAASTQILKNLSMRGVTCFAATHDIELTSLLTDYYANYHFEEEFDENGIRFNYLLQEGKATSQNAIRLLESIGYDEEIIAKARDMACEFTNKGVWSLS